MGAGQQWARYLFERRGGSAIRDTLVGLRLRRVWLEREIEHSRVSLRRRGEERSEGTVFVRFVREVEATRLSCHGRMAGAGAGALTGSRLLCTPTLVTARPCVPHSRAFVHDHRLPLTPRLPACTPVPTCTPVPLPLPLQISPSYAFPRQNDPRPRPASEMPPTRPAPGLP